MQTERTSLAKEINLTGKAVHSGAETTLRFLPLVEQQGIYFTRTDLPHQPKLKACYDNVIDTRLCTTLGNQQGDSLSTVEHLMAALCGCGIDDVEIEVNGAEVPVMDGSSQVFVDAIKGAGVCPTGAVQQYIYITKQVEVRANDSWARFSPADNFHMSVEIDFPNETIGKQCFEIEASSSSDIDFDGHFASARTFGFYEDLENLRSMGLAQGSSLDNTIAIKDDKVMNKGALRYENEFVRHKALDALGDLALATLPIIGRFESYKGGHSLNNQLLHALFNDDSCYKIRNAS